MKVTRRQAIKFLKHQINNLKAMIAKAVKALKSYILDLVDAENKLEKLEIMEAKERVYIFADDCKEFTRDNTINGGEKLVLPQDYIHGNNNQGNTENILSALKTIGFKGKLWEKGEHKRIYITCISGGLTSDSGRPCGYIDLVSNRYHCDGVYTKLASKVREILK